MARAVDAFVRDTPHRHSSGTVHRGLLTAADPAAFRAGYETPVSGTFRGTTALKAGAWSQGPVLLQTLAILDGFTNAELDLGTAAGVHRVLEALKLALADRKAYYGEELDPTAQLSAGYADRRRGLITGPVLPPLRGGGGSLDGGLGEPTVAVGGTTLGDTCHLDVVDRWGTMISATPSGGWPQSSPVIPEVGFSLGTRLQMTWLTGGLSPQAAIEAPVFHTTSFPGSFRPRTGTPARGRRGPARRRGHRRPGRVRPRDHPGRRLDPGPPLRGGPRPGDRPALRRRRPARRPGLRHRPLTAKRPRRTVVTPLTLRSFKTHRDCMFGLALFKIN
ncbi:gamma-glutamyltransferase [Actinoplanes sp. NPDC051494]|uniref:gamma-glutamyltransferase n=1 Tax=Actinoplanes sp. NPDC051494 TaxID=3363907 RepID=UPI00379114D7